MVMRHGGQFRDRCRDKRMTAICSWIRSDACGPMISAPMISPRVFSASSLTKPNVLARDLRLAVVGEGITRRKVIEALFPRLGLGQADQRDLGVGGR